MWGRARSSWQLWHDILKCHMCSQNLNTADKVHRVSLKVEGQKKHPIINHAAWLSENVFTAVGTSRKQFTFRFSFYRAYNGFLNLQSQHVKMWTYNVLWQRWQKWPARSPVGWERVGLLYCAQAEQMVPSDAALVRFIKEVFCRPLFNLKCSDKFFSRGDDPFSFTTGAGAACTALDAN